ncbi:hypothetical protein NUSPORA_01086 [Nucleospora cyclopteri]
MPQNVISKLKADLENPSDNFEWNNYEFDVEQNEFNQAKIEDEQSNLIDQIVKSFYSISTLAFILHFTASIFNINLKKIFGVYIYFTINFMIISSIYIVILHFIFLCLQFTSEKFNLNQFFNNYSSRLKLLLVIFWFIGIRMEFDKFGTVNKSINNFLKSFSTSGVITCIVLIFSDIILQKFSLYFINKSVRSKIKETNQTENILRRLESFRYDNSNTNSDSTSSQLGCFDVFTINICGFNRRNGNQEFDPDSFILGDLKINPPVLKNVNHAIDLAKDVFLKASHGKDELSFDDFAVIFTKPEIALKAFAFFDSDHDRSISKKEFRNTILFFYKARVWLEQSISANKDFAIIISRIWYLFVDLSLIIIYLVVFGIPLTKIATVFISSALAFNVVIGETCSIMSKNFIMLLSHQFDIGDDIIVDGEDLKVYHIGLSTTSFINVQGGKLKIENSDLWKKTLINMTKAPKKIIAFSFDLPADVTIDQIQILKKRIHTFLISKIFDFMDHFKLINQKTEQTDIDVVHCTIILKCKGYKNRSKKFLLRLEFTNFLRKILSELKIDYKIK